MRTPAYGGYGQEHGDELLLLQDGMADERVDEACKSLPAFFDEAIVGCDVIAVN